MSAHPSSGEWDRGDDGGADETEVHGPIAVPGDLVQEHNVLTLELLDAVVPCEIGYNEGREPVAVRVKRIQME